MLTSIAGIAAAVSALIGVGYAVVAAIKKSAEQKKIATINDINEQLKKKPLTDQEREDLQNALNKLINS